MKMKVKKSMLKKVLSLGLCAAMTVSLAACGKQDAKDSSGDKKDYVYVPEYVALGGDENSSFNNVSVKGNALYYMNYMWDEETMTSSETLCEYSLEDGSVKEIALPAMENGGISCYEVDADKNVYMVLSDYSTGKVDEEGFGIADYFLNKCDSQGNILFQVDITETVNGAGEYAYVQDMAVDAQGNIYICMESTAILVNSNGEELETVEVMSGWINSMSTGKDGKVYICYYGNSANGGLVLSEVDFAGKKIGATYKNFPNMNGNLAIGAEKDFLGHDGSVVYEYDMESQSYEELFSWLDCDINGSYVDTVAAAGDGKLVAIVSDWDSGTTELVKLTRTAASQVVQKEEIVIGTMYDSQELQAAAVNFNKSSDTYHVTIKTYIDTNNWTETSYQDAITGINNDITSGSNCPDILDLSQLNLQQLAAKGVFEDLNPYLEKSEKLSREDFLDNLLEGYTYDGRLVTIPSTFQISTIVGKTSLVGEEMGWSLDEMFALAKEYPDAQLFDAAMQATILQYCMVFNQDRFIDWSEGKCYFDTDDFKKVLEFAGMFPEEIDWNSYTGGAKVEERRENKILLDAAGIYDFQEIQIYAEMFGEAVTFIGFPTTDGSVGCALSASSMYAITSKSDCKDGAWAFIESFLANPSDMFSWGFPSKKADLQAQIEEVTKIEYLLDENGEQVLDENGEPILLGGGSGISYEDWEYTYHIPTADEVALVEELLSVAKPVNIGGSDEIMTIITEEAEGYFKGQKSIDEVVDIIQSRAQIYISENN